MTTYRNHFARLLLVLMTALAAASSLAQPAHGPGGPGGPGGGPAPLAMLLLDADVHTALGLNAAQEAQWTALQVAAEAARTERDTARAAFQALVASQFASGAPDLVAIEDAFVAEHEGQAAVGEALSAQAVALYSGLDAGQVAVVVAAAQARYTAGPRR